MYLILYDKTIEEIIKINSINNSIIEIQSANIRNSITEELHLKIPHSTNNLVSVINKPTLILTSNVAFCYK